MKVLKKLAAVVLVAGIGCALYFGGLTKNVSQKAAKVISAAYGVKKADAINSETVDIFVNDEKLHKEPAPEIFMTDKLAWMADAGTLSRIFNCEIERLDAHTIKLQKSGKEFYFTDESDVVRTLSGDKLYENSVLIEEDRVCLGIRAVSELLGADFSWRRINIKFRLCCQRQRRRHCLKNLICAVKGA